MTDRALIITHDGSTLYEAKEAIAGLGEKHDVAETLLRARKRIAGQPYAYILLDIQFPTQSPEGKPRVQNAENFLDELQRRHDGDTPPVVVLTRLAGKDARHTMECMRLWGQLRDKGATDIAETPCRSAGRTLERVIKKARGPSKASPGPPPASRIDAGREGPGDRESRPANAGDEDGRADTPAAKRKAEADERGADAAERGARSAGRSAQSAGRDADAGNRDANAAERGAGPAEPPRLKPGESLVLQAMARTPHKVMYQADIAVAAGYSRSATGRHLRALMARGLVARPPDSRRGVVLTAEGEKLAKAEGEAA